MDATIGNDGEGAPSSPPMGQDDNQGIKAPLKIDEALSSPERPADSFGAGGWKTTGHGRHSSIG